MSQPTGKPLRPEIVPLVDLFARLAFEAIMRGEFKEEGSGSVPDQQQEVQKVHTPRSAA